MCFIHLIETQPPARSAAEEVALAGAKGGGKAGGDPSG